LKINIWRKMKRKQRIYTLALKI